MRNTSGAREAELKKLKGQLFRAQAQVTEKDAEIARLKQIGQNLTNEHAKCTGLQQRVTALEATQVRDKAALLLFDEQAKKAAEDVGKMFDAKVLPLNADLLRLGKENDDLKLDLQRARQINDDLRTNFARMQGERANLQLVNPATEQIVTNDQVQQWEQFIEELLERTETSAQRIEDLLEANRLQQRIVTGLAVSLCGYAELPWPLHNILRDLDHLEHPSTDEPTLVASALKLANQMPGLVKMSEDGMALVWPKFQGAFDSTWNLGRGAFEPEDARLQFVLNVMAYWEKDPCAFPRVHTPLEFLRMTRAERARQDSIKAAENTLTARFAGLHTRYREGTPPPSSSKRGNPAPSSSSSWSASFFSPMDLDRGQPPVAQPMPPVAARIPPFTPPRVLSFGSAPVSPATPPQPHRGGAGPSRVAAPRDGDDDWTPSKRMQIASTVHMNLHLLQRSLPPNHKRALITVTQKISAATQNQYKLHACIGHRDKETAEVEITWSGIMPSNAYNNHPVTGRNYHYYQMGPRIHDITEFGDIAVLNEMEGAQYGTDPLVKDVRALVNVLAEKQEYFPGIRDVSVDKGAPVAEFVSLVFPQFVRFVRMFHGVSTFEMTSDSLATLTKAGRAQQSNTATKLKHPRLILLLPQSCMMGDVITTDDREYKWPSDWRIVWADLAEESS
jgi:hypothetical protein